MRVAAITFGSEGDVRPLIALGQGLVRAGHEAVLLADTTFAALAASAGVKLVPLAGGSIRDPAGVSELSALLDRGLDPRVLLRAVLGWVNRQTEAWGRQLRDAAAGADALVVSGPTVLLGLCVGEALGLPMIAAGLAPFMPTREFLPAVMPPARLPAILNRPLHQLVMNAVWFMSAKPVQHLRRSVLGLPAWPWNGPWAQLRQGRVPILTAVSPSLVPRPVDWPDYVHMTGGWFLDAAADYQPPEGLAHFLEVGPRPVYVGFGSMAGFDAGEAMRIVLEALDGRRAVIAAGWGGLASAALPSSVFAIEAAPHDWLLSRMAVAVHHGGAGTTHAVARAGIPQIVVPHLGDQGFWGQRIQALGAAPLPLKRKTLTARHLADALREAETAEMRAAAVVLGNCIRAENGVAEAVRHIERARR